jgi:peptidyl-prolyl cis-trans isomerase SurA
VVLLSACNHGDSTIAQRGDDAGPEPADPAGDVQTFDPDVEYAASHILIMYRGVPGAPASIQRTRAEADDLARRILVLIHTDRAWFEDLARKYSDDPRTRDRGGYLGVFKIGELIPAFEQVLTELQVGEVGGPVETEYGFHVVRREPLRKIRVQHILVAWRGARKTGNVERTKEEALELARDIHARLLREPDTFCTIALSLSDDPNNSARCGELGWVEPGEFTPEIDALLFRLRPGEVSEIVESPFGFHVFRREPAEQTP